MPRPRAWLLTGAAGTVLAVALWRRARRAGPAGGERSEARDGAKLAAAAGLSHGGAVTGRKGRVGVDREFVSRLKQLLKVCFPRLFCKATAILGLHSSCLVARTLLSIYIAKLDGSIVRALVDRDGKSFVSRLLWWCCVGVGASFVNSQLKYLESKLAISFRTSLTNHALARYMEGDTYYRVGNLDSRLANADQLLTEDVWQFAKLLAHLWSHLSKPVLDVALISAQMITTARSKGSGVMGPGGFAFLAVGATTKVLQWASPPFGRLVKEQAELEGNYRFVHSRLITNSEEIAFYGGDQVERGILQASYTSLVKHMNYIFGKRVPYNMLEGFLLKYLWSTAGYAMTAWPTFFSKAGQESSAGDRMQDYVTARGLLINAADAIERIMSSYKEITELAGYTHRVSSMMTVFEEVTNGVYERPSLDKDPAKAALLRQRGEVSESADGTIVLHDVPIVSPIGDVLVEKLNMKMSPGMHVLVSGPNGAGKSSLFRVIASLWPCYGGQLVKPKRRDLFYVPQRPYLSLGNLRDQVLYPHTAEDMRKAGRTDEDLMDIMRIVHLTHIVRREGGWDAVKPWMDVLSGGEKQRVGMARLFYHKPKYAVLDECTSAVSMDVEGSMCTSRVLDPSRVCCA